MLFVLSFMTTANYCYIQELTCAVRSRKHITCFGFLVFVVGMECGLVEVLRGNSFVNTLD
jgi:hypothetical protein